MRHSQAAITGCILAASLLLQAACTSLPFERVDYKAYPTAKNASDFFGRVYAKTRVEAIKEQQVTSAAEASQQVGFPVRLPAYLPQGLETIDKIDTSQPHAYQIIVNLNTARVLLQSAGIPIDNLPTALEQIQVEAVVSPGVGTYTDTDQHFVTFLQSRNPSYEVPAEVDPYLLEELGRLSWQYLGLTWEQAAQLSQDMNWASFLALPPSDMDSAEGVIINGVPGVALHTSNPDISHRAILWEEDGILYGMYSSLPLEEIIRMAESLE